MKLIALVLDLQSAARYLAKMGEPTDVPARSKSRGPPVWKSTVLRRKAGGAERAMRTDPPGNCGATSYVYDETTRSLTLSGYDQVFWR